MSFSFPVCPWVAMKDISRKRRGNIFYEKRPPCSLLWIEGNCNHRLLVHPTNLVRPSSCNFLEKKPVARFLLIGTATEEGRNLGIPSCENFRKQESPNGFFQWRGRKANKSANMKIGNTFLCLSLIVKATQCSFPTIIPTVSPTNCVDLLPNCDVQYCEGIFCENCQFRSSMFFKHAIIERGRA